MTNKFLKTISEKKYLRKMNDEVIDFTIQFTMDDMFIINKFLKGKRRTTKVRLEYPDYRERDTYLDKLKVYNHIDNFRLPVPNGEPVKSVRCPFCSVHIDFKDVADLIEKPWINHDYNIYLVNPSLYRIVWKGTVTLGHVQNLDYRYFKGMTDQCVNSINELMIEGTGEPLFYII